MTPRVVTLTTDFGESDPYVAAIKGVLCAHCHGLQILDLSHHIPAQDVWAAAFFLAGALPFFPAGTVHVAVVDPGVGTARRPLALRAGGQFLIGPDNGLFSLLLRQLPVEEAREIANTALMLHPVSPTFHGRDIFAPAAAHLAGGGAFDGLGPRTQHWEKLDIPTPDRIEGGWGTKLISIDHFGNAITCLHRQEVEGIIMAVRAAGKTLRCCETYGDAAEGEIIALFGSSGYLEVAQRNGNAALELHLERGAQIEVLTTLP